LGFAVFAFERAEPLPAMLDEKQPRTGGAEPERRRIHATPDAPQGKQEGIVQRVGIHRDPRRA
jgi:hypothetical protein